MVEIKPQPGPQEAWLSSKADIAIYGGAAGGLRFKIWLPNGVNLVVKSIPELTDIELQRFKNRIKPMPNGCHEWQAAKNEKGYGTVGLLRGDKRMTFKAHRVAFKVLTGIDPLGNMLCHSCDNPACCNPDHLWIGDNASNMADCARKGRIVIPPMGGHNRIELSEEAIAMLGKMPDYKLAQIYGANKRKYMDERKKRGIPSYAQQTGNTGQFIKGGTHPRWKA